MTVYYLVPDSGRPSWGVALLRGHVRLLARNSIAAETVVDAIPRRLFQRRTSTAELALDRFQPQADDVLVVPEVRAADETLFDLGCRKAVFVQGSFLIHSGLAGARDYQALGYECAVVILPHMKPIVEKHYGVEAHVVTPYVASSFFLDPATVETDRKRRILVYPKAGYVKAGLPDYEISVGIIKRHIDEEYQGWKIEVLAGKSHEAVARLMKSSVIFVNVNSHEGFNTTVPEAMAAGCVAVCYDAFGGLDYLVDGENAFVFPNHHVYPMVDRVLALMRSHDRNPAELDSIRDRAYSTARRYTEQETEQQLVAFFREFLAES